MKWCENRMKGCGPNKGALSQGTAPPPLNTPRTTSRVQLLHYFWRTIIVFVVDNRVKVSCKIRGKTREIIALLCDNYSRMEALVSQ